MTTKLRLTLASVLLAAALGLICASTAMSGGADKSVVDAITKIAEAAEKGDDAAAKKLAMKASSMKEIEDNSDLMHLFKPRNKGGLGWGSQKSSNPATDGLEKKVQDYAKKVSATEAADPMNKEAAGYIIGLSYIVKVRGWTGPMGGGKTKKAWDGYADDMMKESKAFAKAVAGKNANDIKAAADKLNNVCLNCHSKFK